MSLLYRTSVLLSSPEKAHRQNTQLLMAGNWKLCTEMVREGIRVKHQEQKGLRNTHVR